MLNSTEQEIYHVCIAIILIKKRELVALLNSCSRCLVMVERLFLTVPWGCLRFVIVVFPDHTHLLFFFINVKIPTIVDILTIMSMINTTSESLKAKKFL